MHIKSLFTTTPPKVSQLLLKKKFDFLLTKDLMIQFECNHCINCIQGPTHVQHLKCEILVDVLATKS